MISNNFKFGRTKTLGIEPQNNDKVFIKIPLETGGFWEKEYLQNDLIGTVINDFKEENHVDIPKDYFMDWNCKNKSLKMTDKIKSLIVPEIPTICFNAEMKKKPLIIQEAEIIPQVVGKPFNNPFEIFLFKKKDKTLKIQTYDENIIQDLGLNNYSSSSSYCNGNNQLFISGGETLDNEIIDRLWQIDLINNNINDPIIIPPKKNHSMIFIPPNYVFIVGGNDKRTFYFDSEKQEIFHWADLNIERIEPALQRIGNILYCFDNVNKISNGQLTFEKTDLSANNPEWNIIYPNMDQTLTNEKLPQKFFGVSKDLDNVIIFLGGNMDNYTDGNKLINYKYNPYRNIIELSDVPYRDYNFKEKTFLPYNKNIDYILPDFNKQHPEVVFYVKNKSKIEKVNYKPNSERENILRSRKRPLFDSKYDFNMPSITIPDNLNENLNINNNIKLKSEPKYISPYASKEIHEPSFQEYDFNLNYKIEQPPPFKEPEIEANKGDQRLSIEIPINLAETKKETKEININLDEEEKNEDEKAKIKLRHIPKPVQQNTRHYYPKIPIYKNELTIPRFHYSVNDPGNELIITSKGKIYTSYIPREPTRIKSSHADFNVKSQRIKKEDLILPNFNYSVNADMDKDYRGISPGISARNINFNGNLDGDIHTPNIHMPQSESINLKDIKLNSPDYKISGNVPGVNIKGPKINTPSGNFQLKGLGSSDYELKGFIPGTRSTKFNANAPNIDLKGPKFKSPDYELSGKIPGINPQIDINGPNLNLNAPKVNLKGPKIDRPDYNLNGNIEGNIDSPKINLKGPDYNLNGSIQGINVDAPKLDIPSGNIKLKGPNINKPDVNIDGTIPGVKVNAPGIDIPKGNINLKGPKLKKSNYYLTGIIPGLKKSTSNINIKGSNKPINYSLNAERPELKSKSPRLHMHSPNFDFDVKGSRRLDNSINKDISLNGMIPGMDLKGSRKMNLPSGNLNLKGPKINGDIQDYNLSGNISGVNIKSPNIKLKSPNISGPDYDLKGELPGMKINMPKVDIKSPNIDLKGPDYNAKGDIPGINVNAPKIDMPSGNIDINGPKLQSPNINLKGPNIKGPDFNVSGNIPGASINGPKANLNLPNKEFNMVGIIPGSKSYRSNMNINGPNVNLKGPNINGPDYNLKGDLPGMKINIPKVDIKSPNVDLKGPDYNASGNIPGIKINSPNLDIPSSKVNLRGPKINTPNYHLSGNISGVNSNNKDFELSGIIPSYRSRNPNLEIKNFKINQPDIKYSTIDPSFNNNVKASINYSKGGSPGKKNFHGNLNDPNYLDYSDIKGSRRALISSQIDNNNIPKINKYKLTVSGNKIIDEQDVILQDPFNLNNQFYLQGQNRQQPDRKSINLVVSQLQIQPESNINEVKIKEPNIDIKVPQIELNQDGIDIEKDINLKGKKIDIKLDNKINNLGNIDIQNDNKLDNLGKVDINVDNEDSKDMNIKIPKIEIKNDIEINPELPNINVEKPNIDKKIVINKKEPTNLRFKPIKEIDDNNFGINVNINNQNSSDSKGISLSDEDKFSKTISNSERGNSRKKKGKGLPMVGVKSNNFKSSRIDVAGKLDVDNIDVNNLKSGNVGVNGVKLGGRIIE